MKMLLLLVIPLTAVLSSCSSTPSTRIAQNPQIFNALGTKHQDLVKQGKIARGMTPPAVFLAMGNPDSKSQGEQHGKRFERWHYSVLVPVYYHGFSPYYGCGYGRYGYRGRYGGIGVYPSVHYVPRHGSTIEFRNNKVVSWSQVKRNY